MSEGCVLRDNKDLNKLTSSHFGISEGQKVLYVDFEKIFTYWIILLS
jgi:hypothetical protein